MLKIITSLSFLYAITIVVLVVYGFLYYRDFARSARHKKRFPIVFLLISVASFLFLWINIHAPLRLKTFSNLDHQFIRLDGFLVNKAIELGRSDTVNFGNNAFNNFSLAKKNNSVTVISKYSEEPFFAGTDGRWQLLSKKWNAPGHAISFRCDAVVAKLTTSSESSFMLSVNNEVFEVRKQIRKGVTAWSLFKDENSFINSIYYTNEKLVNALRNLSILKNDVANTSDDELSYFMSGRLFQYATNIVYDQQKLRSGDLEFIGSVPDKGMFAWGTAFMDNNRNQFRVENLSGDSFLITNRYPVSYPLAEENTSDWSEHGVSKFLVSSPAEMLSIPAVFREGFLFSSFARDSSSDFSPVLLTYQKSTQNEPIQLKARWLNRAMSLIDIDKGKLLLPARSGEFSWQFSFQNSFNWDFGGWSLGSDAWQWLIFGSLFLFFAFVFFTSLITDADKLSWVWQLLSSIVMVMLTTRLFLYWRYKSFPPYEGMDLPSLQQLNSFWNFGVIIFAAVILVIVFGYGLLKYVGSFFRKPGVISANISDSQRRNEYKFSERVGRAFSQLRLIKKSGAKGIFFVGWLLILSSAAAIAYINNFTPGACRHLAIGLIIAYFGFVLISYRHSPLVSSAKTSWWRIDTSSKLAILVSNPVKVLLSISMLAVFVFIDIGFAIVFLNFLLFNEAFLCTNYAIAGLSAGSRRNAMLFGASAFAYMLAFVLNLLYAPFIFQWLLTLPQSFYFVGYVLFAIVVAYNIMRLSFRGLVRIRIWKGCAVAVITFAIAALFFPKEKILNKAAMTKYRIAVLTMPVEKAIEEAYEEGKTYEPVIRAAQNQWFINTLIYEKNNPGVESPNFHLIPHAPQNKGAKYNAQATDLVASRFFLAEHGKWAVLLFVLVLLLPATLLGSFYKLYPDFSNRTNSNYPTTTVGFSILNYFLISGLLVILAATGRYIFFGQDLPFGSILSKQSILFPSLLIIITILLFSNKALEYYANRQKLIPGIAIFSIMTILLFFVKPTFNKNKEFNVADLSKNMDSFIQLRLQPLMDYFDTARKTVKYPLAKKDQLFTDSLRKLIAAGVFDDDKKLFAREVEAYARMDFLRHLDQNHIMYLDLNTGKPQLAVNDNYFRVEPPPHLQQSWSGNVFGDSSAYNIALWNNKSGSVKNRRLTSFTDEPDVSLDGSLSLRFASRQAENLYRDLFLVNKSSAILTIKFNDASISLGYNDSVRVCNPWKAVIVDAAMNEKVLVVEPDAFMKNYYVNGSRFYVYPMAERFMWARNFAESIASDYSAVGQTAENPAVSFDYELMDSLSLKIQKMMNTDTAYKKGAEYGICIADGNGRVIVLADYIKGLARPDPNDKAAFNKTITGENGYVSQSLLRKQIGNINLLRMNPGPGSTFKPIVFSAIASQLNLDWDAFEAEGFSQQQKYFGGERVAGYDFEKNNGRISRVVDYLKYSDNYYHSDVLLLGSYPKQNLEHLLSSKFLQHNPDSVLHWPYFGYKGTHYWLDGFKNWPGYVNGKADFGTDSSFISIGLLDNYGIYTRSEDQSFDRFSCCYDSLLFLHAFKRSGFILPEYALFDQQGTNIDCRVPYDVFANCFRGHVKGSSQVLVPPTKMLDAFGKLVTQSRGYSLTLNPYAEAAVFTPFSVDNAIMYNNYLSLIREGVFMGMREVLYSGTASALGALLKNTSYYYYAKTGTTGDNELKTKSKLFAIVISKKDITDPGFNFRNNKFYTIYFTSQNGPAKQNEQFQKEIIQYIERSPVFNRYMLR